MLKCSEAWRILADVSAGLEVKASGMDDAELKQLGLIAPTKQNGDGRGARSQAELDRIRARLGSIADAKDQLAKELERLAFTDPGASPASLGRKYPNYSENSKQLESLETEERALRTQFVGLVQASVEKVPRAVLNGEPVHLTFQGREVMTIMGQRMARIGDMQMRDFLQELDSINAHFQGRAARANQLLQVLSPTFKQVDEIHLRLVSVGLSGREGDSGEGALLFTNAFRTLSGSVYMDTPTAMLLAEVLALKSRNSGELDANVRAALPLVQTSWYEGAAVQAEQVRAAAIILASGEPQDRVLERTINISNSYTYGSLSAAAVMACSSEATPEVPDEGYNPEPVKDRVVHRFQQIFAQIRADYTDPTHDCMASALMASSGMPVDEIIDRFARAVAILEKFNGGSMRVPAAMISILPADVDEAMDNVRLASAAVHKNKLSLGGAENLSLGIKMLVHSSALAVTEGTQVRGRSAIASQTFGIPAVLALTGISVATAFALGVSLLAFHEFSLHRIAVQDWSFHPVHTHYVYG